MKSDGIKAARNPSTKSGIIALLHRYNGADAPKFRIALWRVSEMRRCTLLTKLNRAYAIKQGHRCFSRFLFMVLKPQRRHR